MVYTTIYHLNLQMFSQIHHDIRIVILSISMHLYSRNMTFFNRAFSFHNESINQIKLFLFKIDIGIKID